MPGTEFRPAAAPQPGPPPVAGGRGHPSRPRSADGGDVGPESGGGGDRGPRFDGTVARGGYAWWYLDALSDDGAHGLTVIGFIGSVFSPYYAAARRRSGPADPGTDPRNHCALNVVLYGPRGKRWAMTERGRDALHQDVAALQIGPSALVWDGTALTVRIEEIAVPLPARLRGTVRLYPAALTGRSFALDAALQHHWSPLAPIARVEVALQRPSLTWSGAGYLDHNAGSAPLEAGFHRWDWSRGTLAGAGGATVLYDAARRDGTALSLALRFDRTGRTEAFTPPPPAPLPPCRWGVARGTRGEAATVLRTLEDTPFYARSVIRAGLLGEAVTSMHESLSLDRFRTRWVQALLPFRMPRRGWGGWSRHGQGSAPDSPALAGTSESNIASS